MLLEPASQHGRLRLIATVSTVATSQQRPPAALKGLGEEGKKKKSLQELATKGSALHMTRLCQNYVAVFSQSVVGIFI